MESLEAVSTISLQDIQTWEVLQAQKESCIVLGVPGDGWELAGGGRVVGPGGAFPVAWGEQADMVLAKKLPAGTKSPPSRGHRGGTGAQKAPGNSHSFCDCHMSDRGSPFKGQPYFWHFGPLCSCWL